MMQRLSFKAVRAVFVFAVAFGAAEVRAKAVEKKPPNVLLIVIDDQGYGDFSCHGNPVLKTPNMDALAAAGVRLDDFHVSSWCSQTRASLMTGRYCRKVGVHGTNRTEQHLAVEAVTMADLFAANGYATGIFGKWHLGDRYPLRPMDRGFAESVVFLDGAVTTVPDHWGNDYYDDTYLHNGKPQRYEGYCTDVWFDLATQFIEANQDRPFFCYLPTNAAHFPFIVPEPYAKPYRNRPKGAPPEFYGMIAHLDERLGRLRQRLTELDLERDTILIWMGDNGTAAGAFNAGMRGTKTSPYDGGHRVACFMHYPAGGIAGGGVVDSLAAHVDILPTLVDLAGLKLQSTMSSFDGVSLKPLLTGEGAGDPDRVLIDSFHYGVMTERWRLIQGKELYDIQQDPGQKRNVAEKFPDVVEQLRKELYEYQKTEDHRPHFITVGADQQSRVVLTGEDWPKNTPIFQHSNSILRKHESESRWNVDVAQAGRYRLSARRWPKEVQAPINGRLPKEKWCYGMTQCAPMLAQEARLRVANVETQTPVDDEMQAAEFIVELSAGPTTLETWFVDADGQAWDACYLEVERLPNAAASPEGS